MKKKEINEYHEPMVNTSIAFLSNSKLISVMMTIVFKRTRYLVF